MTTRDVARRRLATQHLTAPALRTPGEVVSLLGAAQSQEFALATWSVAQRAPGLTPHDVQRAYDAGELLRTHVMRPTWHFVTPADLGLLLALTGPRVHQVNGHMYRSTGLDAALLARTDRIITDTLADGRHRTRAELAEALAAAGVEASSVRLAYVVMHAELEGLVCSGAMRGRQHTYALLAERAPDTRWPADRDEALAELAVRYFTGHGPATARDLGWWSGLTRA
ncbi:MAG TPA: crosslink repair DNA glycosylase YcaQ family protein, partial [Pseudonocardiaceae bacterium]